MQGGFVAVAESGMRWEDIELTEREWVDYDEKANAAVSIMNLQWEFRRG